MNQALVPLNASRDVITARELVRKIAAQAGFSLTKQTYLTTAVSEIARNAITHGGGGEMLVHLKDDDQTALYVIVRDDGPGITDIEQAMQDGWSSEGGLGAGLPGARRLVHHFEVVSSPGQGTTVTLEMYA